MFNPFFNPFMHPGQHPSRSPGMPPMRPPMGPPMGHRGPQLAPPPANIPEKGLYRVDPGSIRRCKGKYTYIWLDNGKSFWFYPTYVGRKSISGYRWMGFWWVYYGVDLDKIESFVCV